MSRTLSLKSVTICAFFLLQIIAPMTMAQESQLPTTEVAQTDQLEALQSIGIMPSEDLANGWFDQEHSAGGITLLYRTSSVVPIEQWSDWTASDTLNGRYVITHQQLGGIICSTMVYPVTRLCLQMDLVVYLKTQI
jgi:hypothetical protein